MARHIELNPVSFLTVGTVGEPGQRTFYLQGSSGTQTISLTIEKEQAATLAANFESLLKELAEKYNLDEDLLNDALDVYETPRVERDEGKAYVFARYCYPQGRR